MEARLQATDSTLALSKATGSLEDLVSPKGIYGYFWKELEDLQEVGYKGSVNYGRIFGSKRKPLSFQSAEWVWAI